MSVLFEFAVLFLLFHNLPTSRVEWEDIVNAPTIIPAEEGE